MECATDAWLQACLLACVNEHPKPADLAVLCAGEPSKEIQECLQDTCPEWGIKEAPKYYQKICNDAGHQLKLGMFMRVGGGGGMLGESGKWTSMVLTGDERCSFPF